MLSCWHVTSPVVNNCLLQSCPGAALSMPSGADPVNRAISDLIFIMQEALTPPAPPHRGFSRREGKGLAGALWASALSRL